MVANNERIALSREVEAIQIPSGDKVILPLGTQVLITQSLGGTYTVATEYGLARIPSKDADALGVREKPKVAADPVEPGDLDGQIWAQLKTVYDPEIPVNIVDLGLVYDCGIEREEDGVNVLVKMTLTAPGCGMGPTIAADAQSRIMTVEGVKDARVELVWDPPWNQDMISLEGKMKLGMV